MNIMTTYPTLTRPESWVNKAVATFLMSQLEGHARTLATPFLKDGLGLLEELRRKCSHLTPQLKLETYQRVLGLSQSKRELASHYLARWKNMWIEGTQVEAF